MPLKYLSNVSRTLEMPLINCESAGTIDNQVPTFTITDRKLYVPAVTLSTQDDAKLLKLGFKRAIN